MTAPNGRAGAVSSPVVPAQPVAVNGSARLGPGGLGATLPTRQRHNGFVALAVALIVGLAAIGAYLYSQAGAKTPVVMVVRDVPAGQLIERSDLTTVPVSGPVVAFAGDRLSSVVGQRAAVTLLPDMLLQRSMVTSGEVLAAGQAQVGVAVRSGQIPADGLVPGEVVRVVQLPVKGGVAGQAKVLTNRATVFSARADPAASGGTLVTLEVRAAVGTQVAAASSAGAVALVKVPS